MAQPEFACPQVGKKGGDTLSEGLLRRAQEPCGGTSWAMEVVCVGLLYDVGPF
jgi:hypothetical protein